MDRFCVDCGKPVTKQSLRCKSCNLKFRWREGLHHASGGSLFPSEVRGMAEVERAWVGALIEGEGHINPQRPLITVAMTDIEPISTLLRLTGGGAVWYQARNGGDSRYKPIWWWALRRKRSVIALLEQISPYLASKQDLAEQRLEGLRAEVS